MTEYFKLSFGNLDGVNLSYSTLKDTDNIVLVTFGNRDLISQPTDPTPTQNTDIYFTYEFDKYIVTYINGTRYVLSALTLTNNSMYQLTKKNATNYDVNINTLRDKISNKTNKIGDSVNGSSFMLLFADSIYSKTYIPKECEWSFYNGTLYSKYYKNFPYIKNGIMKYDYSIAVTTDPNIKLIFKDSIVTSNTVVCSGGFKGNKCEINKRIPCSNRGILSDTTGVCKCDVYNNEPGSLSSPTSTVFYSHLESNTPPIVNIEDVLTSSCLLLDKFQTNSLITPDLTLFNTYTEIQCEQYIGVKSSDKRLYYETNTKALTLNDSYSNISIQPSSFYKNGFRSYTLGVSGMYISCFKRTTGSKLNIIIEDEGIVSLGTEDNPIYSNWNVRTSTINRTTYYHFLNLDTMRFLTISGDITTSTVMKFSVNTSNCWVKSCDMLFQNSYIQCTPTDTLYLDIITNEILTNYLKLPQIQGNTIHVKDKDTNKTIWYNSSDRFNFYLIDVPQGNNTMSLEIKSVNNDTFINGFKPYTLTYNGSVGGGVFGFSTENGIITSETSTFKYIKISQGQEISYWSIRTELIGGFEYVHFLNLTYMAFLIPDGTTGNLKYSAVPVRCWISYY